MNPGMCLEGLGRRTVSQRTCLVEWIVSPQNSRGRGEREMEVQIRSCVHQTQSLRDDEISVAGNSLSEVSLEIGEDMEGRMLQKKD